MDAGQEADQKTGQEAVHDGSTLEVAAPHEARKPRSGRCPCGRQADYLLSHRVFFRSLPHRRLPERCHRLSAVSPAHAGCLLEALGKQDLHGKN